MAFVGWEVDNNPFMWEEWEPRRDRYYLLIHEEKKAQNLIRDQFHMGGRLVLSLRQDIHEWCLLNLKGLEGIKPSAYVRRHRTRDMMRMEDVIKYSIEFVTEKDAILFRVFWL